MLRLFKGRISDAWLALKAEMQTPSTMLKAAHSKDRPDSTWSRVTWMCQPRRPPMAYISLCQMSLWLRLSYCHDDPSHRMSKSLWWMTPDWGIVGGAEGWIKSGLDWYSWKNAHSFYVKILIINPTEPIFSNHSTNLDRNLKKKHNSHAAVSWQPYRSSF